VVITRSRLHVRSKWSTSSAQAATVLAALGDGGVEVAQLSVGDPSLDEVFLALTGKPAEAVAAEAAQP